MPCPDDLNTGFGVPDYVARSICMTRSYFGQNMQGDAVYAAGTGFLIATTEKFSAVLTAAHNVYNVDLRRPAKWVSHYFGRRGDVSHASRDMVSARYPDEFDNDGSAPANWDFAVVKINYLDPVRFKPIPMKLSTATTVTKKILIGYPTGGLCSGKAVPYHAPVEVAPSSTSNYRYLNQQTYPGMSGGPLLTPYAPFEVYGLHIRGGNNDRAVRLSSPVRDRIDQWLSVLGQ